MLRLSSAIVLVLCVFVDAFAGEVTTSPGQPLCDTPEHLQEWILAAVQHDDRWIKELSRSCTSAAGGSKIVIIEDLPSDSDIGHVVKVRVFGKTSGSVVGYTVSIGLNGLK
jgi:hypothetical protein